MTASFPWYDLPSVQWANDALWAATGLGGALDRTTPIVDQWCCDDLLISQSCGLDLLICSAPIEPVLRPVFALDAPPGEYFSYLVTGTAAQSALTKGVGAVNSMSSHSGLVALLELWMPEEFLLTGSHRASIAAVREGSAECAAIDAVVWHLLQRDAPEQLQGLRIVGRSDPGPAPPFVCRTGDRRFGKVLARIVAMPDLQPALDALLLRDLLDTTISTYQPLFDRYERVRSAIPERLRLQ
ncbi:MAG: PhnD/SsuA/transferrin family substrate-binding protein [Proteobacteria bacterium]|nr:PhnD/SsuA/transferrin family substrate-binding protein [Pseudomonadota bacterium]